jgi:EAL domain-containing protein (putative c-di-GMP-specific phosphodiesterase class I)
MNCQRHCEQYATNASAAGSATIGWPTTQEAGLPFINVSVNVSARQFSDKNLFAKVVDALQDSGLAGSIRDAGASSCAAEAG